jgi:hypothetical protein
MAYYCRCGFRCSSVYDRQKHERRCQLLSDDMDPSELWVGSTCDSGISLFTDDICYGGYTGEGGECDGGGSSGDY